MSKKVKCSNCGYLCLEKASEIFLGDRTIFAPDPLRGNPGWRNPEYDTRIDYLEITPQNRRELAGLQKSAQNIYCYRHAFVLAEEVQSTNDEELSMKVKAVIEKSRDCKYHVNYISGYNPEQHLMRWENEQREKTNRFWSLVYILIGTGITIIGALSIKLIFG